MKNLLTIFLIAVALNAIAQKRPLPGTKEYQEMKAKGKFTIPAQAKPQKNYPVLRDARLSSTQEGQTVALSATPAESPCLIPNPAGDASYQVLPANDDGYTNEIALPFSFNFYGNNYTSVFVNNNGNISFNEPYYEYTSTGFPVSDFNMVAPFWADVDTRGAGSGLVYYKVEPTRMTVIWYNVGYYSSQVDKRNTFKLIITNGADPILGAGNNVGFFYGDMQWASGSASGGSGGFGGTDATVGLNKGTGTNACFFYQMGRFGKPGSEFLSPHTTSGIDYLDNKCFYFDASTIQDVTLDFSSTHTACEIDFVSAVTNPQNCLITSTLWEFGDGNSSSLSNPKHIYSAAGTYTVKLTISYQCGACSSNTISVEKQVVYDPVAWQGVAIDFTYRNYYCATSFEPLVTNPQRADIISFQWDFGDGNASTEYKPLHSFAQPGTYQVKVSMNYQSQGCPPATLSSQKPVVYDPTENPFKDTVIQVSTNVKKQVISSSVATFSDAWPLDHPDPALSQLDGFVNASRGVWRNEGQYVYKVETLQKESTDITKEGTYELELFNWEHAELNAIPNWIKANTMTGYSSYGYEVENQDVLGIHTAALYDYGGHLPSANGVNMKNSEMAFTSFEYLDQKTSGNWKFGNLPVPVYTTYEVETGYGNMAVVKATLAQLEGVQFVDVSALGSTSVGPLTFLRSNYLANDQIVCKEAHPSTPNWSVVVLRRAPFSKLWKGKIRITNVQPSLVTPDTDLTVAHSGKTSLKVTSEKIFEQGLLKLDSGKTYLISAWVSVNDPNVTVPKLADGLGVEVTIRNKKNEIVSTFTAVPDGPIIEGWQQVKGTFACSINSAKLEVKFKPGSTGTAWYDDLRLHPEKGNMKTYVYNLDDYRLQAILDEENFASFYYYDKEGNLKLVKKETEDGIKTISENISYQVERN